MQENVSALSWLTLWQAIEMRSVKC